MLKVAWVVLNPRLVKDPTNVQPASAGVNQSLVLLDLEGIGAVGFGLGFRNYSEHNAFLLMASVVVLAGFSTIFINIKGHQSLIRGQDSNKVIAAWKKLGDKGALIGYGREKALSPQTLPPRSQYHLMTSSTSCHGCRSNAC